MTGYLSCQIFLMTFVNWPDKDLRPVADSVSFGADKIGSDLQRNRKKSVPNWSASVWPDADIWTRSLTVSTFFSKTLNGCNFLNVYVNYLNGFVILVQRIQAHVRIHKNFTHVKTIEATWKVMCKCKSWTSLQRALWVFWSGSRGVTGCNGMFWCVPGVF